MNIPLLNQHLLSIWSMKFEKKFGCLGGIAALISRMRGGTLMLDMLSSLISSSR